MTVHTTLSLQAKASPEPELLPIWNGKIQIPGLRFYLWNRDRLDSFSFSLSSKWRSAISKFLVRLAHSVLERLGGSASRQNGRKEIAKDNRK